MTVGRPADTGSGQGWTVGIDRWRSRLDVTVRPGAADPRTATRLAAQVLLAEVDRMELAASRFRADSELSAVNRGAGQWVDVSDYLADLVREALHAAEQTDGLTNPCLGVQVERAGYQVWANQRIDAEWLIPPGTSDLRAAWQSVEVRSSATGTRIRIPAGSQLDLGAIAKGWLADEIAGRLGEELRCPVLANMGGDLAAVGRWAVAADPELPGVSARSLTIEDAGIATSSRARRRWQTTSGSAHHIIDARTGLPAHTQWWSVSVLARTAAAANTASTAAMVLDEHAPGWLANHSLDAWLVSRVPGRPTRSVTTGHWPRPGAHASNQDPQYHQEEVA
jgi:thiamine biosynthesis lipoprotein